jgi:hypothetical protein
MKYIKNVLMIFILYSTLISCEKKAILSNDKKEFSDSLIRPLGNLGFGADTLSCIKSCYVKLTEPKDSTFVIKNYSDYNGFKNYVSCLEINNWPSVDFDKNNVLAGISILGMSCGRIIPEKFSLTNHNGNYKFIVVIKPGVWMQMSVVFYWVIINKINPDSDVEFIIEYVNPNKI